MYHVSGVWFDRQYKYTIQSDHGNYLFNISGCTRALWAVLQGAGLLNAVLDFKINLGSMWWRFLTCRPVHWIWRKQMLLCGWQFLIWFLWKCIILWHIDILIAQQKIPYRNNSHTEKRRELKKSNFAHQSLFTGGRWHCCIWEKCFVLSLLWLKREAVQRPMNCPK